MLWSFLPCGLRRVEQVDQALREEDTIAFRPRHSANDPGLEEFLDQLHRRGVPDIKHFGDAVNGHGGFGEEVIDQLRQQRRGSRRAHLLLVAVAQKFESLQPTDGIVGFVDQPFGEELDPAFPAPVLADIQQVVIVPIALSLKVRAGVEQRHR